MKLFKFLALGLAAVLATGCIDDAHVATHNTIKAADNFEINRRIVFYNGITDNYILEIEGRCSVDLNDAQTAFNVICKTGEQKFKRHTLVLSDNVTAFVEQIDPNQASSHFYRVTFKPSVIVPDVDVR
ncbi:hypothetical protein [Moraxella sp.]|uniref:beta-sandwich lipoprotein n=1 Tax=Moraxella sp. TaxID=479 RepID=UPI0026DB257C|nr:hypothetical protein [Moraxella sp.]MDO4894988.1 hypothetical protein [Moraxella sp.]